jgi:hypothetical protein
MKGYLNEKQRLRSSKPRLTAVCIRCADHVSPIYPHNLAKTAPTAVAARPVYFACRLNATKFVCFQTSVSHLYC